MNKRKAFTLIELLVVIAIIAILAAILFPVFAQAKTAAKKSTNTSNMKQDVLACTMYSGEYDDMSVVAIGGNAGSFYLNHSGGNPQDPVPGSARGFLIQPYAKNYGLLKSPFDGFDSKSIGVAPEFGYATRTNHGYNIFAFSPGLASSAPAGLFHSSASTTGFSAPANTLMLVDSANAVANGGATGGGSHYVIPPCINSSTGARWDTGAKPTIGIGTAGSTSSTPQLKSYYTAVADHKTYRNYGGAYDWANDGKVCIGYADGHTAYKNVNELWKGCDPVTRNIIAGQEDQFIWGAPY